MYQIVKHLFPFADNPEKGKPRPSLVISPSFGRYKHLVLAYITSDLADRLDTDIFLDGSKQYFKDTGLHTSSVLKVHRLITVSPTQIGETIGIFPEELVPELKKKLKKVFQLK